LFYECIVTEDNKVYIKALGYFLEFTDKEKALRWAYGERFFLKHADRWQTKNDFYALELKPTPWGFCQTQESVLKNAKQKNKLVKLDVKFAKERLRDINRLIAGLEEITGTKNTLLEKVFYLRASKNNWLYSDDIFA